MRLLEYQAKQILRRFGVSCLPHYLVDISALASFDLDVARINAQWKEGADAVVIEGTEQIKSYIKTLLEDHDDKNAKVMVEPYAVVQKGFSLSVQARVDKGFVVECVLKGTDPIELHKESIDQGRLYSFQVRRMAVFLRLSDGQRVEFGKIVDALVQMFFRFDVERLDIGSFVSSDSGPLQVCEITVDVDDNALFRQPEMRALAKLVSAKESHPGFESSATHGSVLCLANGRYLAMASEQFICFSGGSSAGFWDIGEELTGKALIEVLERSREIQDVEVVFVHLFTGLTDAQVLARAIVQYLGKRAPERRLVFRLEGVHALDACKLLKQIPQCFATTSLREGARLCVEACCADSR